MNKSFTFNTLKRHTEGVGQTWGIRSIHPCSGDVSRNIGLNLVPQLACLLVGVQVLVRQFAGAAQSDNARDIIRASPAASFLVAA
jgi:hypothetical protein